jgi:hypothetical protein
VGQGAHGHAEDRQKGTLDVVSRWLIAARSAVIIMTFTSAAFAGLPP